MSVISSNTFRYLDPTDSIIKDVFIEDNGSGSLSFCQTIGQTKQIVLENAGTVDYGNGIIRINQVQILSPADDPEIKIFAIARNQRYVSVQDKILINDYLQDPSAIIVTTNVSTTTPSLSSMSEMSSTTSSSNSSSTSNSSSGGGGRNDSVVLSPDNTSATITPPRFGGY